MDAMAGAAVGGVIGLLMVAVIGFAIGVVAKLLMSGPDPGGWFVTILLGIAGSWAGGFLFGLLGLEGGLLGFVGAVLGAMLLLRGIRRAVY
ncbi:MAG TPA: GlsB/YeaQ/YmgE family stress response membrane protein [Accumulibacter sp.]|uniref:GlsB/YeaQ/YmgE family stress response membrane protein n=1 Tax=Accumulibacter sp. TaxID=2053492 RepID=UPI002D05B3B4|nr:GlsB/YeaQ/YmgE family stress response membrane protein [Accumulibacter sp.]HRD88572.1 GlsB/YeaQ/YmgE family stress response membrane protein [Accumulibacter sp.]